MPAEERPDYRGWFLDVQPPQKKGVLGMVLHPPKVVSGLGCV